MYKAEFQTNESTPIGHPKFSCILSFPHTNDPMGSRLSLIRMERITIAALHGKGLPIMDVAERPRNAQRAVAQYNSDPMKYGKGLNGV